MQIKPFSNSGPLKSRTVAAGVLVAVVSTIVASGWGLARQAPVDRGALVDWNAVAETAWRGLATRYHPSTGLFDASADFRYATVWEIASALAATHSAERLGLISRAEYDLRIGTLLNTLERVPLVDQTAFNIAYTTNTGLPVNAGFEEAAPENWSALHHGRLLLWLHQVASNPRHRDQVTRVVNRLDLNRQVSDGYLMSGRIRDGRLERYQDGRVGYEQYAARGYQLWGVQPDAALKLNANARMATVEGYRIPHDKRGGDRITSEPFLLHGLELGWSDDLRVIAQALLAIQEQRYRNTGRLTAASADAINRGPDFFYTFCILCDGRPFLTLGASGKAADFDWLSTEAAYGWHALLPSEYTANLVAGVQAARDSTLGWSSGVFEDTRASTGSYDLNTAAALLESAVYARTAKPIVLGAEKPTVASNTSGPVTAASMLPVPSRDILATIGLVLLILVITLVVLYSIRHYIFTLNRLFGRQRHPYVDVREADWPSVTVAIPAHNEEKVITHVLDALLICDYPRERLEIMVVNDRSTDRTAELIDEVAANNPGRLIQFHRATGTPGKAAALKDALATVTSEIILIFDADYLPGVGLIKQLVAPFFDPEVGAVMGRVVPINAGANLLTRLLDLERAGGYQVDQQARMNLGLVPQFGGTVGGLRRSALESVGGWRENSLTEDTDVTYRLLLRGWKTAYQNRSECYEEVPEEWPVRTRQIRRWARGHNECMRRYMRPLMHSLGWTHWLQRIDGAMLLGVYAMSAVLVFGWVLVLALFFGGVTAANWLFVALAVASYSAIGNFAVFFEIAAAARLDGYRNRIRLLPLLFLGFVVSVIATARTVLPRRLLRSRKLVWHKTERSRTSLPMII